MDLTKIGVTRLNNRNYRSWAFKVEMVMCREGTWKYVVPPNPNPDAAKDTWLEGDAKARAVIALLVEDNQHNLIMGKITAKAMWDALKAHHHKATLTGKVAILKEICSKNYTLGECMEEFLYALEDLFSRLENAGEKLSNYMQVAMLLRSLPKQFDTLTTALESRTDEDLTMDLVRSKLIDEAEKINGGRLQAERVLKAVNGSKAPGCFSCGNPSHKRRNCPQAKESQGRNNGDKKNTKKSEQKIKKVREGDNKSFTFMVRRHRHEIPTQSWLIDSGATSHICSDPTYFVKLRAESHSNVVVADGSEKRIEGVGVCVLHCVDQNNTTIELTLQNVLYVPTVEGNMLSVSKLAAKGVHASFDDSGCKFEYAKQVIAVGDKKNDMYWLRLSQDRVIAVKEKQHTKDCQHTWHRRLGHRDPQAVKEMQQKDLVSGLKVVDCGIQMSCESCVAAKMTRPPFPRCEKLSTSVLDGVHTDVCGPMRQTTLSGYRFYVTMIDDYSRFTVVYFLKHKSEIEARIREYVRMVETRFGRKPRAIRSDQGGEYSEKTLRQFYLDEGIQPQYTAAYSPQQNGVSSCQSTLVPDGRVRQRSRLQQTMRYKRVNTLALDVSSVPAGHRISTVQPFLTFLKLDPSKLRSVQVHSSRKTIYIGLPDDHSAAAIAAKTPRFAITIDGTKHHVPVVFVDEDITDVRVRDVPPETPNDDIQATLRKYGEVLSVTSEVWRDFFPGVLTGVRIARMKISQNIPSFVRIGSSLALINYDGQSETCSRCGELKHPEQCKTADKKQKKQNPLPQDSLRPQTPREISGAANEKRQQQQQQQPARVNKTVPPASNKTTGKPHTVANNSDTSMEVDDSASSGFTTVMRKKGKATHQQQPQQQQQQVSQDSSSSVSCSLVPSEDDLRKRDAIIAALQAFGVPIDVNTKIKL